MRDCWRVRTLDVEVLGDVLVIVVLRGEDANTVHASAWHSCAALTDAVATCQTRAPDVTSAHLESERPPTVRLDHMQDVLCDTTRAPRVRLHAAHSVLLRRPHTMRTSPKLSMSITMGAMPMTRESTAPVSHVVHPRLEAPHTRNPSIE